MAAVSRYDLEKMAFSLVDMFMGGSPLEDSILNMAKDRSLNAEQIRRLVEMANTSTFLRLFKDAPSEDRVVKFKVADPEVVIKRYYSTGPGTNSKSVSITMTMGKLPSSSEDKSIFFDDVADETKAAPEPEEKVASFGIEPFFMKRSEYQLDRFSLLKAKDSLLDKIADCDIRANDMADELAASYRGIYSREKLASLEADSVSKWGNNVLPAIQLVRSKLGHSKIARELSSKELRYAGERHLVEAVTLDMKKLSSISEVFEDYKNLVQALKSVEGRLADV
tara:strand:+ start:485 stop:1324 length:840 start_codon:yes stop_codon:yes gene_type:complete